VTAARQAPRNAACQVAVVGGGLSGMAAAALLAQHGLQVDLFEARQQLGGRVTSFRDRPSGHVIDLGQHVSMGCCTCLADFCRAMGLADCFTRCRTLHLLAPSGRLVTLRASSWLPAPLHLLPAFLRMGHLPWRDRLAIVRGLYALLRADPEDDPHGPTIGQWLRQQRQSDGAIDGFWEIILVSALGETLDRASLVAARKVIVDALFATRDGYELLVPNVPLAELCGTRMETALRRRGVRLHLGVAAARLTGTASEITGLIVPGNEHHAADHVVVAVPWWQLPRLLPAASLAAESWTAGLPSDDTSRSRSPTDERPLTLRLAAFQPAPITSVHLWYDRLFMPVPHAALLGRLSHWVFQHGHVAPVRPARPAAGQAGRPDEYHYQVIISGSHGLQRRPRAAVVQQVNRELCAAWPDAHGAQLLRSQLVTHRHAVFSPRPGLERLRPPQRTDVTGLTLSGDWTATGWPATMESAVRSGYLAAQAVLDAQGIPATIELPEPHRETLARWLLGRTRND
jgi:squalene-associated FAD-dependent desaturase